MAQLRAVVFKTDRRGGAKRVRDELLIIPTQHLQDAFAQEGKGIHLALDDGERPSIVKRRYTQAAKNLGHRIVWRNGKAMPAGEVLGIFRPLNGATPSS